MLKMGKYSLVFPLLSFILGTVFALNVHSAPLSTTLNTHRAGAKLAMNQLQPEEVAVLPRPPPAREGGNVDIPALNTSPKELHFIKVQHYNYAVCIMHFVFCNNV